MLRLSFRGQTALIVWETQPEAIGADIFYESSQMYKIENDLHMGGTAEQIAAGEPGPNVFSSSSYYDGFF